MKTTSCAAYKRMGRRDFLTIGGTGLFGLTMSGFLQPQARAGSKASGKAKNMILIWLSGGPPHIDMFDMKPDAPADYRGEFKPIQTNVPGMEICELMPRLAKIADKYTIMRSCSIGNESFEHSGGNYWLTGNPRRATPKFPSYGSVISKVRPTEAALPTFVNLNGYGGSLDDSYLGSAFAPLRFLPDPKSEVRNMLMPQIDVPSLERREDLFRNINKQLQEQDALSSVIAGLDETRQKGFDLLRSPKLREAMDLTREPIQSAQRYGKGDLGQRVLVARRLVEAGIPCVWLNNDGWDFHGGNFTGCRSKLPEVDAALSALLADLDARGLLETTIVAMLGEMGRTPKIGLPKTVAGREHWGTTQFVFVAGGGFKGGTIVGATDKIAAFVTDKKYKVESFGRTLYHLVGIDADRELLTTTNRPMKISL